MISMRIYKRYKETLSEASQAVNNISTGKKVSSAKDNPNKIAEVETLDLQVKARDAATQNIQDTNSMIQTFDGALQEINNNLLRLKELTVKAVNGTYTGDDKAIIQKEIDATRKAIDALAEKTTFNGKKMTSNEVGADSLNTTHIDKSMIGILPNEVTNVPFFDLKNIMKLDTIDVTVDSATAIETVDKAVVNIARIRSKYGALQSKLEDNLKTSEEMGEVYTRAQSSCQDADIAQEMLTYAKTQVLYQSSIGLLAQSNKLPQDSLNVLANVR
jgi:flagellin